MPLRAAVTGKIWGPELDKVIEHLGRNSLAARVEKALQLPTNKH